jgi:hypothetical protein
LQLILGVHALIEDADDGDFVCLDAIKNRMVIDGAFSLAPADGVIGSANVGGFG